MYRWLLIVSRGGRLEASAILLTLLREDHFYSGFVCVCVCVVDSSVWNSSSTDLVVKNTKKWS